MLKGPGQLTHLLAPIGRSLVFALAMKAISGGPTHGLSALIYSLQFPVTYHWSLLWEINAGPCMRSLKSECWYTEMTSKLPVKYCARGVFVHL